MFRTARYATQNWNGVYVIRVTVMAMATRRRPMKKYAPCAMATVDTGNVHFIITMRCHKLKEGNDEVRNV